MQVYRHRLITRVWHWINALAVLIMIPSGLMIFNAHPRLYWGNYGANFDPAWLELPQWPGWLTLPSSYDLAGARHWHLAFALVLAFSLLIYLPWSLINRHIQRDLRIRAGELAPSEIGRDLAAHWQMRFHDPANPRAYNFFQKASYVGVLFVLLPLLILTGLAMAPGMWPWLAEVCGGRQSARSLHFIAMGLLTLFLVAHLALVILAGPLGEVWSMITGWWKAPEEEVAA